MIRQIAEAHKLLGAIKRLHEENTKSLKAEIARLENELLEARKANTEIAKLAMDRYFEIKRLKKEIENKKVFLLDDDGKPIKEFTLTGTLTVVKEKLEAGKWYDARTFEVEKLKELLPAGTKVAITTNLSEDEQRIREPKSCIGKTIVTKVAKTIGGTAFYVIRYQTIENYWFKIIEED